MLHLENVDFDSKMKNVDEKFVFKKCLITMKVSNHLF